MVPYKIKVLVLGGMSTNCYLLYNDETKETIIIDPGSEEEIISGKILELQLQPKAILLTHGHFDHIQAVDVLCRRYDIKTYAHEQAAKESMDTDANLSSYFAKPFVVKVDELLKDDQEIKLAGYRIQVLHTPGHTPGSVCYYLPDAGIVFTGDTLFAGSVGRSDFPGGSASQISQSVKNLVAQIPEDVEVYPGHGEQTSIWYEKSHNPFV